MNDDFEWLDYDEESEAPVEKRRGRLSRFVPGFLRRRRTGSNETSKAESEAPVENRRGRLSRFVPGFLRRRRANSNDTSKAESDSNARRGLFRFIPRFFRRRGAAPSEVSAADLALQMGDRPVEELDDRLQALRGRASSRTQEDSDTARQALYDVDEVLVTPEIIHRPGGVISPLALSKAQQEQVELLRDMVGVNEQPASEDSSGGRFSRPTNIFSLASVPQLLISLVMLLALALPFVSSGFGEGEMPPTEFGSDRPATNTAFNLLDNLTQDDFVLVAFEYGPTAAGELDAVSDIILRHLFAQGAKPIIVSGNPIALVHARNVINEIRRSVAPVNTTLEENKDYFFLRFLSGGALGLRDLSRNFGSIVTISATGKPTGLAMTSLEELSLIVLIAERADDIRNWAEQVATETRTHFVAATGHAAQPLSQPYADQFDAIFGLIVGFRDAYTYGEMLDSIYGDYDPPRVTAGPSPTPTTTATATATPTATTTPEPAATATATPTETPPPPPTATPTEEQEPVVEPLAVEPLASETPLLNPVVEVITAGLVNIRRSPTTTSDILALARAGDIYPVLGENEDGAWINILLPDGVGGWIASFLVEQYLAPAGATGGAGEDSADAGGRRTVLRLSFGLQMGKNRPRFYQADQPIPGDRAEFVVLRDQRQDVARLDAMTLGTIAAVLIILSGNMFYAFRALARRRRDTRNR